jgi:ribonuclease HII
MLKKRRERTASLLHERLYHSQGYAFIFGIDEVGRGPWAGPVVAGAVCLPITDSRLSPKLKGVKDSKMMTPRQRESLVDTIKEVALAWGIGKASSVEINDLGISPATRLAMRRALESALETVDFEPSCLFIDSVLLPEVPGIPQVSLVGGDARSLSIAAASVVAKVWRDDYMVELDAEWPQYGFAAHKGYGTPQHQAALKEYGPSPLHRLYYKPIQALSDDDGDSQR